MAAGAVPELRLEVSRFVVEGDNPLSSEVTHNILAPFQGTHTGIAGLEAAADALEQALRARGLPFHRVILPPQTPTEGSVILRIVQFVLGRVDVKGNTKFSAANIRRSLPALRVGAPPDADELARSLAIANDNPSKHTVLTMREGAQPRTIDALISVRDSDPQQVYAALNNTGSHQTGYYRASLGYQHANLLDRDHVVTLSFTTSPDHFDDVKQYGLYYSLPFYALGSSLSLYYTYSDVNSGRIADFFQVSGRGQFLGARSTHALPRAGAYTHKVALGLENRQFENDVSFSGTAIGVDVGSTPLSLRYSGRWERANGDFLFHVEHVANLAIGGDNNDAAYLANRANASRSWRLWRFGIDFAQAIAPGWSLNARVRGQHSSEPLIPGEQFGIGGTYSVRGLREREIAGDSGLQASLEIATPQLPGNVQPLFFVDLGYRQLDNVVPGQSSRESVASLGMGMRWQWQRRLDLYADIAHVLSGIPQATQSGDKRLHFGMLYRF